ncbi:hypothetical protein JKP88DRAFT_329822 [Tribonema minus]|uniref:Phytanoyl-CoA dioxygenase n=1 Tax=Tribonema minus TaxID=303371 RepID=A0A835YWK8_9STRA|nr:hypothetical protein JKP88DRAFT_329822 [Tribonema minus]
MLGIMREHTDGFVLLRGAFPRDAAAACRAAISDRLRQDGIAFDDPSTWVERHSIPELYGRELGPPWSLVYTPRLAAALDQLLGAGAWRDFGLGWWFFTFPGVSAPPWGAAGHWHVDGAHLNRTPASPEGALILIVMLSDVAERGGGTALAVGSHRKAARLLWAHGGEGGLRGPRLSRLALAELMDEEGALRCPVVETRGKAGDVMLLHPLLLHARSKNLAPSVRVMCNPAVSLRAPMALRPGSPHAMSPVERVIWQAQCAPAAAAACAAADDDELRPGRKRARGAGRGGTSEDQSGDDDDGEAAAVAARMGFASFGARRQRGR